MSEDKEFIEGYMERVSTVVSESLKATSVECIRIALNNTVKSGKLETSHIFIFKELRNVELSNKSIDEPTG